MNLASIRLRRVGEASELEAVRAVLLPVSTDPRALALLEDLRVFELLATRDSDPFASRFAAAELARETLGAPVLARNFFMEAAQGGDAGLWQGKAALAALTLSDTGDARRSSAALVAHTGDPYVAAARNRYLPLDTLARLDAALQPRLDEACGWAREEARRRDVLIRSRAGGS